MPEVDGRPAGGLSRPVPRALAVSEFPSAGLLGGVPESGREAVHSRGISADVAPDGRARGHGSRAAYRDVEHDDPEAAVAAARLPDPARGERDGDSSALPAAGAVLVREGEGDRAGRIFAA